jgi:hypothetical protein
VTFHESLTAKHNSAVLAPNLSARAHLAILPNTVTGLACALRRRLRKTFVRNLSRLCFYGLVRKINAAEIILCHSVSYADLYDDTGCVSSLLPE